MAQAEVDKFTLGSLYIIGFAQARSPHAGLIIPTSASSCYLVHIHINRDISPFWVYQSLARSQAIAGDMFCTTLLKLRDVADGAITVDQLGVCAELVEVSQDDEFEECLPWGLGVVERLGEEGRRDVTDVEALEKEFEDFAVGNKAFARRAIFPNVRASGFCA